MILEFRDILQVQEFIKLNLGREIFLRTFFAFEKWVQEAKIFCCSKSEISLLKFKAISITEVIHSINPLIESGTLPDSQS